MSWDCGLKYMFSVSPALQQGSMCILHDKEDLSRLEMVQRLAKDGCRFLQSHSKGPERTCEVRKHSCKSEDNRCFYSILPPHNVLRDVQRCWYIDTMTKVMTQECTVALLWNTVLFDALHWTAIFGLVAVKQQSSCLSDGPLYVIMNPTELAYFLLEYSEREH